MVERPDLSETNASHLSGRSSAGRKLIAVVYADMVGYSRLIGLDDVGTLEQLRALRSGLIDPAIAEHGGRIVQTGGDSLLIVFDSIDGAVRCAVKLQQQMTLHDAGQPADRTIRFRMGINIGDAIADGTDLHGDAVNVAVRLQAECPPGGICVSRSVRDHVHERLDLTFAALGTLNLKNIPRPVEAFVLRPEIAAMASQSVVRFPVQATAEALPLPDKPSIAVLAFANMSGDLEQEYFSDGIAEDIITELSRNRLLFVIARNSSFTYKGRAVDARLIARELGVRYIVEGSVRQYGSRIRIVAQLIDAETGNHVWAERFDRDLVDIFAVQDEITGAIVQALGPAISQAEQQRALRRPPESLSAWEAYQRALSHWSVPGDRNIAGELLRRAVTSDPRFAPAHAMLALRYLLDIVLTGQPYLEGLELAEAEARAALQLDRESAIAHSALAWVLSWDAAQAALDEADLAISLNPNDPQGHLIRGRILVLSGRPVEGRESLATALRLDPRGPTALATMAHRIMSHYFERDYVAAEALARRANHAYPKSVRTLVWHAAALGQIGRTEEARSVLHATVAASPSYFDFVTRSRPTYYHRPEDYDHLIEGLHKAGWQG
jgi:adenylate cyclase